MPIRQREMSAQLEKEILSQREDLTKADPELKDFFRNPERFADIFNAVCFEGEQILQPENLYEIDTDVSGVIVSKEYRESLIRNRDVLKMNMQGTRFIMMGIENQSVVDYTMPLRTMLYDGMSYDKEIKSKGSKKKEDMLLTPIVTVVMYYGEKPWDGPLCLKDMMREIPDNLQPFVSDYKINLIEVLYDKKFNFKNIEVKMLFEYTQAIVNEDRHVLELLNKNYNITEDVLYAIAKFVDISELINKFKKCSQEEINMCKLLDDIREEGREEGRKELIVKMKENNVSDKMIALIASISLDEVRKISVIR